MKYAKRKDILDGIVVSDIESLVIQGIPYKESGRSFFL